MPSDEIVTDEADILSLRSGLNMSRRNTALRLPCSQQTFHSEGIINPKSHYGSCKPLRADVSKYRPDVNKSEKSKILKKIHNVALGKLLT